MTQEQGSRCRSCQKTWFSRQAHCPDCKAPTVDTTFYARVCWERLAFMASACMLVALIAVITSNDPFPAAGTAALALTGIYVVAYRFTGEGGLTERFLSQADIPDYAGTSFSVPKYFSEFLYFFKVVFAALLAMIMLAVMGAVFNWICG